MDPCLICTGGKIVNFLTQIVLAIRDNFLQHHDSLSRIFKVLFKVGHVCLKIIDSRNERLVAAAVAARTRP